MTDEDRLKEIELFSLLESPVKERAAEIGRFLSRHYGDDPVLQGLSDLLIKEPKKETNSLHLSNVSALDLWRDVMVGSIVLDESLSFEEAVREIVDYENREDPSCKVSEKSVKASIRRVKRAKSEP